MIKLLNPTQLNILLICDFMLSYITESWRLKLGKTFMLALYGLALTAFILSATACSTSTPQTIDLDVSIKNYSMAPNTIIVEHNDTLVLNLSSDQEGTIHIHGYDMKQDVSPKTKSQLILKSHATGKYNIAFHPKTAHRAETTESSGEAHEDHEEHHSDHSQSTEEGHSKDDELIIGHLEVHPR